MPALTVSFIMDLESNMRKLSENDYARLTSNLWWQTVARTIQSGSRREILTWALSTAQITDQGLGGNVDFEDMVLLEHELTVKDSGANLKLRRSQFEDLDGNGVNLATQWSKDISAYMAYWPQKQMVALLKNGAAAASKSYDAVPFFAANHPNNPRDASAGNYSNLITGVDISTAVSADAALANLSTVFAKIAGVKMPNGADPRYLRARAIITPPKLFPRAVQLTNAKFIAQAATAGGGSGDVEALIKSLGYGTPTMADELDGFETDTTYFVVAEQITSSQLGGLIYVDREPYRITYYTGQGGGTGVDAILDRAQELEWHCHGRNIAGYGHPFLIFKCTA